MRGSVDVFVPKVQEEFESELKNVEKKDVFVKYDDFLKETFKCKGSNLPAWVQDEITNDLDTKKLYKLRSTTTIDAKYEKKTRDDYTDLQKNEKLIQAVRRFILTQDNGVWNGDPALDFTQEEKLLFLNHTKKAAYFVNQISTFKKLNQLHSGDYLGEIALIFNSSRTASIIASKDTYLLWLTEKDYKEIFQSEVQNVREKVDFIGHIFTYTSKPQVSKFCYLLEEQILHHNEVLFKEGDPADHIYIVRNGEIQISTIIKQENQSRETVQIRKQPFYLRKLIISTLTMGSFFGEDEFLSNTPRKYTAVAGISNTLIYKISRSAYYTVIEKYFHFIPEFLARNSKLKSRKLRESMIKQAEIRLKDFKQVDDMLGKINEEHKEKFNKTYTRPRLTDDKRLELRVSVKHNKNDYLNTMPDLENPDTERSNSPQKISLSPTRNDRLSYTTKPSERRSVPKLDKRGSMSPSKFTIVRQSTEVSPSPEKISIARHASEVYATPLKRTYTSNLPKHPQTAPDLEAVKNRGSVPSMPSLILNNIPVIRAPSKLNNSVYNLGNSRFTIIDKSELEDFQREKDDKEREQQKNSFMKIMKRVLKDKKAPEIREEQPAIVQTIMETPMNNLTNHSSNQPYLTALSTEAPSSRSDSRFTNLHVTHNFAKDFAKYKTLLSFRPLNGAERLNFQNRTLTNINNASQISNVHAKKTAAKQNDSTSFKRHRRGISSRVMLLEDVSINKTMRTGASVTSPRSPSSIVDFNKTIQITEPSGANINLNYSVQKAVLGKLSGLKRKPN